MSISVKILGSIVVIELKDMVIKIQSETDSNLSFSNIISF